MTDPTRHGAWYYKRRADGSRSAVFRVHAGQPVELAPGERAHFLPSLVNAPPGVTVHLDIPGHSPEETTDAEPDRPGRDDGPETA